MRAHNRAHDQLERPHWMLGDAVVIIPFSNGRAIRNGPARVGSGTL